MKYTIKYDDCSDLYMMNGVPARFIGEHLREIAEVNEVEFIPHSESHLLAIIQEAGIEVELLESDGSPMTY